MKVYMNVERENTETMPKISIYEKRRRKWLQENKGISFDNKEVQVQSSSENVVRHPYAIEQINIYRKVQR
jgi:hypothetical protein